MSHNTEPTKQPITSLVLRVGTEFVSGIIVGVVFGLGIDHLFDTKPFGLILMILLGAAAGFRNIFRLVKQSSLALKSDEQNKSDT